MSGLYSWMGLRAGFRSAQRKAESAVEELTNSNAGCTSCLVKRSEDENAAWACKRYRHSPGNLALGR
jgi:hypothetical protein